MASRPVLPNWTRRIEGEIELVQFGLVPEFIGQGLGKYFLNWTIDKAWSYDPRRFWLHTCTLDHKAALPNYLKAGFLSTRKRSSRKRFDRTTPSSVGAVPMSRHRE